MTNQVVFGLRLHGVETDINAEYELRKMKTIRTSIYMEVLYRKHRFDPQNLGINVSYLTASLLPLTSFSLKRKAKSFQDTGSEKVHEISRDFHCCCGSKISV
jgi:hypothetical protein